MDTNISESEGLRAFKALKRFFHNPQISNRTAGEMHKKFNELYPHSRYRSTLNRKYWWHRIIRGYRYRTTNTDPIGIDEMFSHLKNVRENGRSVRDILLVSHEMSLTGAPRALLNMAIVLKTNGFNPYIFSFRGGPLIDEAKKAGIPAIVDIGRLSSIWYFDEKGNSDLIDFFGSFQTVMLNTIESITTFPISKIKGSRKLGWIHESATSYKSLSRDEFERLTADFNDIFIVGEHARSNARKLTPVADSFKNLYYGVEDLDTSTLADQYKFNDGKLHLLIAGTIEERKGHHILAKAIGKLSDEEKAMIKVHCAGRIENEKTGEELQRYTPDVVSMEGNMKHDSLMNLLAGCDVLLCPSLDDPMPIVCTEAFQVGIPVLVSDQTGTASFIRNGENGFIVKGGDADDLARGLHELIKRKAELPSIGKRAYAVYNDNFSAEAFRNSIMKVFKVEK